MSYTPPDEELDDPVRALIERIGPAREAMMARLRGRGYTAVHITELTKFVTRLTELEVDLLNLLR